MKVTFSNLMDKHAKPHSISFTADKIAIAYDQVCISQNGMMIAISRYIDTGHWLVNESLIGKGGNNRQTRPKNPYNHIEVFP